MPTHLCLGGRAQKGQGNTSNVGDLPSKLLDLLHGFRSQKVVGAESRSRIVLVSTNGSEQLEQITLSPTERFELLRSAAQPLSTSANIVVLTEWALKYLPRNLFFSSFSLRL